MSALGDFVNDYMDEIVPAFIELVYETVPQYKESQPRTFPANTKRMLELLTVALEAPDSPPVIEYVEELCQQRLSMGFQLTDILSAMFLYNDILLPMFWDKVEDPQTRMTLSMEMENSVEAIALRFARTYFQMQKDAIELQRRAILELSTPVIKVWDGILALPLVGTVDSYRARRIMEELLAAIVRDQADIVIIDITGVPVVDTNVADHLIKTTRAAELLGAECLVVGVGPELAQTIVALGVDLQYIEAAMDLQQGLSRAFELQGLEVRRKRRSKTPALTGISTRPNDPSGAPMNRPGETL